MLSSSGFTLISVKNTLMNAIRFQGAEIQFDDSDTIVFDDGLIGMTALKRMLIVKQPEIDPFMWLVPIEDNSLAFLVVPVETALPGTVINIPDEVRGALGLEPEESATLLAICRIAAVWNESTVNLLSPLAISARTMKGRQFVATDGVRSPEYPLVRE